MTGLFISCESNEMEEVLSYSNVDTPPTRTTSNVTYTYTDSGKVSNILKAGKVLRYESNDSTYSLIREGFELTFFDSRGEFDGRLTAMNGYIRGDNALMIARDSVVFVNRLEEELLTEELIWEQDSAIVYTNKFVTINRAETVLYGTGLESDENFTDYIIKNPTGEFFIDEEE
ncbi:MAG: LPS export ABC transporter periplasmic protein LptC [Bacteroidota bacterium]